MSERKQRCRPTSVLVERDAAREIHGFLREVWAALGGDPSPEASADFVARFLDDMREHRDEDSESSMIDIAEGHFAGDIAGFSVAFTVARPALALVVDLASARESRVFVFDKAAMRALRAAFLRCVT